MIKELTRSKFYVIICPISSGIRNRKRLNMNKMILAKIDQNLLLRDISLNNITDKLTGDPTLDKPYLKFFSKDNILSYSSVGKTVFQYG